MKTNGPIIASRKYACLALVGQLIIIHGGINDFGFYLNDVCVFDILTKKWRILKNHGESNEFSQFEESDDGGVEQSEA